MNLRINRILPCALLGALLLPLTSASSIRQIPSGPTVIEMDMRADLDELGNGQLTLVLDMNATQWAGWQQQYGGNPALFRRDLQKIVSQYDVTDFQLQQDAMDRRITVTIDANAMAHHLGEGVYEFSTTKEMGEAELVNGELRYSYTQSDGPDSITLIDQRLAPPSGAKDVVQTTNGLGEQVVRYAVTPPGGQGPWMILSVLSAVIGLGLLAAGQMLPKTEAA